MATQNELELRIERGLSEIERGLNEIIIMLQSIHSWSDPSEWHRQVFDTWRTVLRARVRNSEVLYRALCTQIFRRLSSRGIDFTAFEKDFIYFWMHDNSAHDNSARAQGQDNSALAPREGTNVTQVQATRGGIFYSLRQVYLQHITHPNLVMNLTDQWVLMEGANWNLSRYLRTSRHFSMRFVARFGNFI